MGVARTVYIRRAVSRVLSSSSLHATSCILFRISTLLPFPPFPVIPSFRRRSSSADRLCPTHQSNAVRLSVRHIRLTLSISLFDTSI